MQHRIRRWSTDVCSPPHAERSRASVASFRESTQLMGFLVGERSIGLTPKGKLQAPLAPSQLNCDTSSYQLLHTERPACQLHPTLDSDGWDAMRQQANCDRLTCTIS